MTRNFKIKSHWLAEVRDIATKANLEHETGESFTRKDIDLIFTMHICDHYFSDGLTPKEAFDEEMEVWQDAYNEEHKIKEP